MRHDPSITFLADDVWAALVRALRLSDREAQIAALLLGDDNREETIAAVLSISPHTVHTHLERLYRKLGVSSRCHVVARVFRQYVEMGSAAGRGIARIEPPSVARDQPRSRPAPRKPSTISRPVTRPRRAGGGMAG